MKDSHHPSALAVGGLRGLGRVSRHRLLFLPDNNARQQQRWPLLALVRIISGQAAMGVRVPTSTYLPRPQPPPLQRHNSGGLIRTPPPFRGWSPPHTHSGSATQAGACKLMGQRCPFLYSYRARLVRSRIRPGLARRRFGGKGKGGLPIWEIAESRSTIAGARP